MASCRQVAPVIRKINSGAARSRLAGALPPYIGEGPHFPEGHVIINPGTHTDCLLWNSYKMQRPHILM